MKTFVEHINYGLFEGKYVPLEMPMLVNEEDVELNKPKRGGPKKFYVFVKNDKGYVVKVTFGDVKGGADGKTLSVKLQDPAARRSYAARHNCDTAKDKTSARYWSCRLPDYAKDLGLAPVDKGDGGGIYW